MKIRAIGTGSAFCRHPLVTSSFLIQSENSNILVGCGYNIPAKLETINLHISKIDMFILLNAETDHIGGLEEICYTMSGKSFLVAPRDLLKSITERIPAVSEHFEVRAVNKVTINEEHFSETVCFVKVPSQVESSYGVLLKESRIFIGGNSEVDDEFLHLESTLADLIFAQGHTPKSLGIGARSSDLQELPVYLQQKIWVYGYGNDYLETEDPLPMLFLPQGTCIFDSDRKDKHLDKERFIRENSKRQVGNFSASQ